MAEPEDEVRFKLADALVEQMLELDDEEFRALLAEAGEDVEALAAEARSLLASTVERVDAETRKRNRQDFENAARAAAQRPVRLPGDPARRRALLQAVLQRNPRVGSALTLQHRELELVSDDDVTSQLLKLEELGLIDESGDAIDRE